VNLFTAKDGERVLVEFQRRRGCMVSFTNFYRRSVQQLAAVQGVMCAADKPQQQTAQATTPALPKGGGCMVAPELKNAAVSLDLDTLDALTSMAASKSKDVAAEGLRSISSLSKSQLNQVALFKLCTTKATQQKAKRFLDLVNANMLCSDDAVSQHAVSIACNLAALPDFRPILAFQMLDTLFHVLDAPSSLEQSYKKRRVANALVSIASTHSARVLQHKQSSMFQSVLAKYYACSDAVLQRCSKQVLQHLQPASIAAV
jgi:hypothetical protein